MSMGILKLPGNFYLFICLIVTKNFQLTSALTTEITPVPLQRLIVIIKKIRDYWIIEQIKIWH